MGAVLAALAIAAAAPPAGAQPDHPLGQPRDDLARFHGIYGTPGDGAGRDFMVAPAEPMPGSETKIPDGHLMIGPLWGDGQRSYMASVGDTRFERRWRGDFGRELVGEFLTGDDGRAEATAFETDFDGRARVERLKDIPADW